MGGRIGIPVGDGVGVLEPPHFALAIQHRIRVPVQPEEGGDGRHSVLNPAAVLDAAFWSDLVTEGDVEVGELPGVGQAAEGGADGHITSAVVVLEIASGVHLRHGAFDNGEVARGFAVVKLRPRHREVSPDGNILEQELGASLRGSKPDGWTHGQAVAVGVLQPLVDPVAGVGG